MSNQDWQQAVFRSRFLLYPSLIFFIHLGGALKSELKFKIALVVNLVLDGVTFYDVILSTHTYQVVLVWLPLLPFGLSQSLEV